MKIDEARTLVNALELQLAHVRHTLDMVDIAGRSDQDDRELANATNEYCAQVLELQRMVKRLGGVTTRPTCDEQVEWVDESGLVGFRACGLELTGEGVCPVPGAHALRWFKDEAQRVTLR